MNLLKVDTIEQVNEKLAHYFHQKEPETELVALDNATGRTLAEDVASDTDMPMFTRSTVDGYAAKASDTFGVSDSVPVFLHMIGESHMGVSTDLCIKEGETVYVPTGGMLPEGADSVVMVEYTELLDQKTVALYKPAAPGSGVMCRGEDFPAGKVMLHSGSLITVKEIGLLACLGKAQVEVYRKPKVALISTGDELVEVSQTPLAGQIRDINTPLISAFLDKAGAEVTEKMFIRDDFEALEAAALRLVSQSDVLLISGGSSQGNKDLTEKVIDALGSPGVFTHGIAIKPGKPTILGAIGEGKEAKLVAGLPGHPMSAITVYMAVIEPFIRRHFLNSEPSEVSVPAVLTENIHAGEGRETWQPVTINRLPSGERQASPIHAKSGSIYQLACADGFVRIPVMSEGLSVGDSAEVMLIR